MISNKRDIKKNFVKFNKKVSIPRMWSIKRQSKVISKKKIIEKMENRKIIYYDIYEANRGLLISLLIIKDLLEGRSFNSFRAFPEQ
jgi:hypothetical protein